MLNLTIMETAELLCACDLAIQKETELINKYADVMPWKAEYHTHSLQNLLSAREKIYQEAKGK